MRAALLRSAAPAIFAALTLAGCTDGAPDEGDTEATETAASDEAGLIDVSLTYPADDMIAEFKATCPNWETVAQAVEGATANGWTKTDIASLPALTAYVDARQNDTDYNRKFNVNPVNFGEVTLLTKSAFGEDLVMILSEVDEGDTSTLFCELMDPGEERSIDPSAITAWRGSEPRRDSSMVDMTLISWDPPAEDAIYLDLVHMPPGSKVTEITRFEGLLLSSRQSFLK